MILTVGIGIFFDRGIFVPDENENSTSKNNFPRQTIIGIIAFFTFVFGGLYLLDKFTAVEPEEVKPKDLDESALKFAVIDLDEVYRAYSANDDLESLQSEERRIKLELQTLLEPMKIKIPEVDQKPFDDSIWQKQAQEIIGEMAAIERDEKRAAEKYRNDTSVEHYKKRDAIHDQYLNQILNLNLKIQNRDVLRLTDEEVAGYQAQIKALQTERSWKLWDLLQEWEAEIKAYAEESVRERKEKLKDNSLENLQKIRDEALKKHAEVQARNAESMQKAVNQSLERQKNRERLLKELQSTVAKRISLENKIDMDLTEKAMRLAYKYRIDVILTTPTKDLNTILNRNRLDFIDEKTYPVVAVDAVDLTNELTDEISRSSLE